jgi:hypothetical protein|tara:strand:+ start:1042 stop:1248 length:207 start_codon:yes stop_codon:yes gene_type:complete
MKIREQLQAELSDLEHRLDLAEHNDSLGMASTISSLYGQVREKQREIELLEEEERQAEDDQGQFGVGS